MQRLQKMLASAGLGSRRACEALIVAGRVKVDGVPASLGQQVDERQVVEVDGVRVQAAETVVHVMLHKPRRYVSSVHDPEGRPTVMDLVTDIRERVYPVGRLDYDSEGLLLLTNDGPLTQRLLHPSHQVARTYHVDVTPALGAEALRTLREGVDLEDGRTAPARVVRLDRVGLRVEIVLREGRNRQVRRMVEALGSQVRRLVRVSMGPLQLGDLPRGTWRPLSAAEVRSLRAEW